MKPLYALVAQHKALEAIDPEDIDEQTLLATLEGLEGEIALKAQSCAAVIRNMECFAEAVEDAAKKMKQRADLINSRVEKVRAYVMKQMDILGRDKIQTPEFTVQIKKNPPSLVIDDMDKIPAKYKYTPVPAVQVDKMGIRDDLNNGDEVPGAHLHQGKRLTIKE
jgi:hypothetical protein